MIVFALVIVMVIELVFAFAFVCVFVLVPLSSTDDNTYIPWETGYAVPELPPATKSGVATRSLWWAGIFIGSHTCNASHNITITYYGPHCTTPSRHRNMIR